MKKAIAASFIFMIFAAACSAASGANGNVVVYAAPTWGCCSGWSDYLEKNDFAVTLEETFEINEIKTKYTIPEELYSCHTAIVNGYIIEGHVPAEEIIRLLEEKPNVIGIAVAGMPPGSPGMDIDGFEKDPYDVVTFTNDGVIEVFSSYPK